MTGSVTMQDRVRRQTAGDVRDHAAHQLCGHDAGDCDAEFGDVAGGRQHADWKRCDVPNLRP